MRRSMLGCYREAQVRGTPQIYIGACWAVEGEREKKGNGNRTSVFQCWAVTGGKGEGGRSGKGKGWKREGEGSRE